MNPENGVYMYPDYTELRRREERLRFLRRDGRADRRENRSAKQLARRVRRFYGIARETSAEMFVHFREVAA